MAASGAGRGTADGSQSGHAARRTGARLAEDQSYANSVTDNLRQQPAIATATSNFISRQSSRNNEARCRDNNDDDDDDDHDNEEDDDSECWDDAKALLNAEDDDGFRAGHRGLALDTADGVTAGPAHVQSASAAPHQAAASLSSAYSSLQSSSVANSISGGGSSTSSSGAGRATMSGTVSAKTSTSADDLILHKAVFEGDREKIISILNDTELIRQRDLVNKRDKHGNTALHLACMLGSPKEIVALLLQHNPEFKWSIDLKNLDRWTPLHEACSYGNRDVIRLMAKQLKEEVDGALRNSKLSNFLEKTKDYRLVLKWEFQSWVPLLSRVLPSDVCVIYKQGKYIRIDTRLLDFEGPFRKKGNCCLVYSNTKWAVMNNTTKKYQYLESPTAYKDLEDRVDEIMSTDIIDLELKSSAMQLTRSTSGWFWKADRVGKVGRFNAALYDFTNVFLVTRKRREHLSEEDLKRNKLAYKTVVNTLKFGERPPSQNQRDETSEPENGHANNGKTTGGLENGDQGHDEQGDENEESDEEEEEEEEGEEEEEEVIHRESLAPPPPNRVSWQEYLRAEPGAHPTLGREQKCKVTKTAVKASVAMSEEFPLTKHEFLDLLSIIPIKMFKKLKEFVEMKLPEGFPVRLDIPVFPFLAARITFEDFAFHEGPIEEFLFTIPENYEEDPSLVPGRF